MSARKKGKKTEGTVKAYRKKLESLRENILADAVMIGEIPSPTFKEKKTGSIPV